MGPTRSAPVARPAFNPAGNSVEEIRSALKTALGTDHVVFIRRRTLNPNHYYTEHINSEFKPGGGLAVLDLNTGSVREINLGRPGVVNRFDLL